MAMVRAILTLSSMMQLHQVMNIFKLKYKVMKKDEVQVDLGSRVFTLEQIENILKSRKLVSKPRKIAVVARQITYFEPEDGGPARYIINLQATTPFLAERAIESFRKEEYQEALNSNMTASVFINDDGQPSGFLPQSGETVNVEIDYITNNDGDQMLAVRSVTERPVEEVGTAANMFAKAFDAKNPLDDVKDDAEKETAGAKKEK